MILFGTGGIRGVMREGEFDERVVVRASKAFGEYILEDGRSKRVVIAYDTRRKSREFANLSAEVFAGMGLETLVFPEDAPTPVLSFACRKLEAHGVVITASHNPPEYNGYKIYTPDGVQAVPEITDVVSKKFLKQDADFRSGGYRFVPKELEEEYLEEIVETVGDAIRRVDVVYTPLHGTGRRFVPKVLERIGARVRTVEEQMTPDGRFPTVRVPNPEDDDALEMLKSRMEGFEMGMATDPDSDRLGVLLNENGEIVKLTGNQMGILLTDYLTSSDLPENPYVVKTIVTTDMVKSMGEDRGFDVMETPTGFKFIGRLIVENEMRGNTGFVFAFEESYGYLTGNVTRDKDGILASALSVVALSKMNFLERLEELYRKYGYHKEKLVTVELASPEETVEIYKRLKENPEGYFEGLRDFLDYSKGVEGVRPNETLCAIFENGRVFIRPSGTEPKLKAYLMTVGETESHALERLESLEVVVRDVVSRARGQG